jgi:hypothetical protein
MDPAMRPAQTLGQLQLHGRREQDEAITFERRQITVDSHRVIYG